MDGRMTKKSICTIVSKNYLPMAAVMIDSFLTHNPDWECKLLLCDKITSEDEKAYLSGIRAETIPLIALYDQFDVDFEELCFKYTVVELNTAMKPFFLEYLFSRGYEKVVYIDPDILVFQPFTEIDNLLNTNDVILTPHMTAPIPDDGCKQSDHDVLRSGAYNLGFIALKYSEEAEKLLRWWQKKLKNGCYSRIEEGLFTDQRWMDLTPALFNNVFILKKKSYNVAFWNLHERQVHPDRGVWMADGEPLVFFHFSGVVLNDISSISKHQNRYTLNNRPELCELFFIYRKLLSDRGLEQFAGKKYWFGYLPDTDIEIPLFLRSFCEEITKAGIHPFKTDHIPRLLRFANEPVLDNPMVSRLWMEIYRRRPDVQIAFPNIGANKESREAFVHWVQLYGRNEYHLHDVFVELDT
jgi:lipopolysaccharide biosynthesis glycosyltransferase